MPTVPLAERAHVAAAAAAAREPRCGTVRVVGIDGRSGSGKTTLSHLIGALLDAPVLHIDDLVPGWDGLLGGIEALRDDVLRPLSEGRAAAYRSWDWEGDLPGPAVDVEPVPTLVVEGCGAVSRSVRPYLSYAVWVQAPRDLRHRRATTRDGEEYVRRWDMWAAQEDALLAADDIRAYADLVVDNADPAPDADR